MIYQSTGKIQGGTVLVPRNRLSACDRAVVHCSVGIALWGKPQWLGGTSRVCGSVEQFTRARIGETWYFRS
jgi:hypothetical protein